MTTVAATHDQPFGSPAAQFQAGYDPTALLKQGLEAEFFITDTAGVPVIPERCQAICEVLTAQGFGAAQEFMGIVEYSGAAHSEIVPILAQAQQAYEVISSAASLMGYQVYDASHLPDLTEAQALTKISQRERAQAGYDSMCRHAPRDCRLLPLLNAGTQMSFSVRNDNELFADLSLSYRLVPFLYAVLANHAPRFEGQDCTSYHPRGKLYEAYGAAGGISRAFLQAKTPRELVQYHLQELVKTPLFFTLDTQDKPVVPAQALPTFSNLPVKQLDTNHFRLAQSFNYHDVKICNIHDAQGHVIGKRLEVRAADAGYINMLALPVIMTTALRNAQARRLIENLLADYGFAGSPADYGQRLVAARQAAVHHQGRYMNVPFGQLPSGRAGRMPEFAKELLEIIAKQNANLPVVTAALSPVQEMVAQRCSQAHRLALS